MKKNSVIPVAIIILIIIGILLVYNQAPVGKATGAMDSSKDPAKCYDSDSNNGANDLSDQKLIPGFVQKNNQYELDACVGTKIKEFRCNPDIYNDPFTSGVYSCPDKYSCKLFDGIGACVACEKIYCSRDGKSLINAKNCERIEKIDCFTGKCTYIEGKGDGCYCKNGDTFCRNNKEGKGEMLSVDAQCKPSLLYGCPGKCSTDNTKCADCGKTYCSGNYLITLSADCSRRTEKLCSDGCEKDKNNCKCVKTGQMCENNHAVNKDANCNIITDVPCENKGCNAATGQCYACASESKCVGNSIVRTASDCSTTTSKCSQGLICDPSTVSCILLQTGGGLQPGQVRASCQNNELYCGTVKVACPQGFGCGTKNGRTGCWTQGGAIEQRSTPANYDPNCVG